MLKSLRVDRGSNGLPMRSHESQKKRGSGHGLLYAIKELVAKGTLLKHVELEIEQLEGSGTGKSEIVYIVFRVPSDKMETIDPKTGVIRVGGEGATFSYTFSGRLSLEKNLREFERFYRKRSLATAALGLSRGASSKSQCPQAALNTRA